MIRIRLEINSIELDRVKKHWNLYFILSTEHPERPGETVITAVPRNHLINIRRPADNLVTFKPEGKHAEGLFVLERNMPEDHSVKAWLWVMHSHEEVRDAGEILGEVNSLFRGKGVREIVGTLGGNLWLTVGKTAAGLGQQFLESMDDRSLGFISMNEHFGQDEKAGEFLRKNSLSTGFALVNWSWKILE